jgi:hypothetical protein
MMSLSRNLVVLVVAVTLLSTVPSCRRRTLHPRATRRDTGTENLVTRYWLKNTTLLAAPGGRAMREIAGPVLVDLLPGGHVRGVAMKDVDGYLPKDVLAKPQHDRGLMLYAQEITELQYENAQGSVIGKLYPGAFVSVVRDGHEGALVGNLPFLPESLVGYVKMKTLASTVRKLEPPKYPEGRNYVVGTLGFPFGVEARIQLWACEPIWLSGPGRYRGYQYIDGVEISTAVPDPSSFISSQDPKQHQSVLCPASSVIRRGTSLLLKTPRGTRPIAQIPENFIPINENAATELRTAIERRETVYWLMVFESRLWCLRVQFDHTKLSKEENNVTLTTDLVVRLKAKRRWFAARYFLDSGHHLARFEIDPLQPPHSSLCCEFLYTPVSVSESEFQMLGSRISDSAIAYKPDETERWYRSASGCEVARVNATKTLEGHPELAPFLGTHATFGVPVMERRELAQFED